jgi:hypothetical protein
VGNRSKRGRPDRDAPDPAAEWQEESRWSGYTRDTRWPWVAGAQRGLGSSGMPTFTQWLGIAIVVVGVIGGIWLLIWLLGMILR